MFKLFSALVLTLTLALALPACATTPVFDSQPASAPIPPAAQVPAEQPG